MFLLAHMRRGVATLHFIKFMQAKVESQAHPRVALSRCDAAPSMTARLGCDGDLSTSKCSGHAENSVRQDQLFCTVQQSGTRMLSSR